MTNKNHPKRNPIPLKISLVVLLIFAWLSLCKLSGSVAAPYTFVTLILPYFALLITLSFFIRYKLIRILYTIIWIPCLVLIAAGLFIEILWSFIYTYVMIFGGTVILVFLVPTFLFHYQIQFLARVYLVLTIASIIAAYFSEKIIKSVHSVQNNDYSQFSERISLKIFGQSIVRLTIIVFYFILLIVFNFSNLNETPLLKLEYVGNAILPSFVTYIAFERIVSYWSAKRKRF